MLKRKFEGNVPCFTAAKSAKRRVFVHRLAVVLSICLVLCLPAALALAQKPFSPAAVKDSLQPAVQKIPAADPLGRDTPQGTVIGFLKAAQKGDYACAVDYLDTRLPQRRARELAQQLLVVLNQRVKVNETTLSRDREGDVKDNLPLNEERIGKVETETGTVDVMLERVQRGNDPPIWLFAAKTLKYVPDIYEQVEISWIERHIPAPLAQFHVLKLPLWRWLLLFAVILLAFLLAWALTRAMVPLLRLATRRFVGETDDRPSVELVGPLRTLVLALAFYVYSPFAYSLMGRFFWSYVAATLTVVGSAWLFLRLIDIAHEVRSTWCLPEKASGRIAIIRLASTILKALVIVAGAVVILYMMGVNLTAVLAGLGVGGIAVAFAAQKTIENLFGGIMIASDRPIRVGDFCRAGDYSGTVVDIGLRSTRLRTLARTIVSVPNGQLAQMSLENFSMRDKILFNHKILLGLETSVDQLRFVLEHAQELLQNHSKLEPATYRVRLSGLKKSGFELEFFAYVLETEFDAFLQIQEELLLQIVDIVAAGGTSFALPIDDRYTAKGPGLEKTES
jgi:MscS family membrane protein